MTTREQLEEIKNVVKAAGLLPFYDQYFTDIEEDLWRLEDLLK